MKLILEVPQHLFQLHDVWDPEDLASLRAFMKNETFRTMPRDTHTRKKEIRVDLNADGTCPVEFLVKVGDACVPVGRVDALFHLAKFGGTEGYKVVVSKS